MLSEHTVMKQSWESDLEADSWAFFLGWFSLDVLVCLGLNWYLLQYIDYLKGVIVLCEIDADNLKVLINFWV